MNNWKELVAAASFTALTTATGACGGSAAEQETELAAEGGCSAVGGCGACGYAEGGCGMDAMDTSEELEGGCGF